MNLEKEYPTLKKDRINREHKGNRTLMIATVIFTTLATLITLLVR